MTYKPCYSRSFGIVHPIRSGVFPDHMTQSGMTHVVLSVCDIWGPEVTFVDPTPVAVDYHDVCVCVHVCECEYACVCMHVYL